MKSLTRIQRDQIKKMTISDEQKKIAQKIVKFVNNKNEYFKENHDNPNTAFDIQIGFSAIFITRRDSSVISIGIYFNVDSKFSSLEISLNSKPDGANTWFINHELLDLVYGE